MNLTVVLSTHGNGWRPRYRHDAWSIIKPPGNVWYRTFSFGPLWIQLDNEQ